MARRQRHRTWQAVILLLATASIATGLIGIAPAQPASATPLVSDDCDVGGINVNDGTISGTYLKVKVKTPVAGQLWICYRVDRNADPVVHEGGKLTLGLSSQPVIDGNASYCGTRPNSEVDADVTVGPDRTPVFVHRISPPTSLEELGVCLRVGSVLFRASAAVRPDLSNKLERDLVTCTQVTGTVTDMQGEPVDGATVSQVGDALEGCLTAGLTNSAGQYTLWARVAAPAQGVTLRAERSGHEPEELAVVVGDPTNTLTVDFDLWRAATDWTSAGCEEDGHPLLASAACTPPSDATDTITTSGVDCTDLVVCEMTSVEIAQAGLDPSLYLSMEPELLAEDALRAVAPSEDTSTASADSTSSSRSHASNPWAAMVFWLLPTGHKACTDYSSPVQNGHCGVLAHAFVTEHRVYWTGFAARSGNNNPASDCVPNVGPLPQNVRWKGKNTIWFKWGYMNGRFTGFESDGRVMFDPGKWRLDPWQVPCARTRGAFEIHGGSGSRNMQPTLGCIRIRPGDIVRLKSLWDHATPNKRDRWGGVTVSPLYK